MEDQQLIVASIPRSGSTYLFRALLGISQGNTTPKKYFKREKPYSLPLIKTHSPPEKIIQDGYKAIFLFRDPVQCVVSTQKKRYDKNHFKNCFAEFPPKQHIYKMDVLGYEKLFDLWNKPQKIPTLLVRYSTMNKHFKEIEEFVGREIKFPKWKNPKKYNLSKKNIKIIKRTYSDLIHKIGKMPEIKIYS